ncbi:MAG: hypothetical protein AAF542_23275 [Pseudomonadota bacterium]
MNASCRLLSRVSLILLATFVAACEIRTNVVGTPEESAANTEIQGSIRKSKAHFLDQPRSEVSIFSDGFESGDNSTWGNPNTMGVTGNEQYTAISFTAPGEILVGIPRCPNIRNGACDFRVANESAIASIIDRFGPTTYDIWFQYDEKSRLNLDGYYSGTLNFRGQEYEGRGVILKDKLWYFNGTSAANPSEGVDFWADSNSLGQQIDEQNTFVATTGVLDVLSAGAVTERRSWAASNGTFESNGHAINFFTDQQELFTISATLNPFYGFGAPINAYAGTFNVIFDESGGNAEPFDILQIFAGGGLEYTDANSQNSCEGAMETTPATWGTGSFEGSFDPSCRDAMNLPGSFTAFVESPAAGAANNLFLVENTDETFTQPRVRRIGVRLNFR